MTWTCVCGLTCVCVAQRVCGVCEEFQDSSAGPGRRRIHSEERGSLLVSLVSYKQRDNVPEVSHSDLSQSALFEIMWVLLCCRTFETSLLLDESISDELPYSGEGGV